LPYGQRTYQFHMGFQHVVVGTVLVVINQNLRMWKRSQGAPNQGNIFSLLAENSSSTDEEMRERNEEVYCGNCGSLHSRAREVERLIHCGRLPERQVASMFVNTEEHARRRRKWLLAAPLLRMFPAVGF
jgi:hypothetical protein